MLQQDQLIQLRELLVDHFNMSELDTLCFDLGVDFESLRGETKNDKARELLAYMQRNDRVGDLIAKVRRSRPDVSWPEPNAQSPPVASTSPSDVKTIRARVRPHLNISCIVRAVLVASAIVAGAWLIFTNIQALLAPKPTPIPVAMMTSTSATTVQPNDTPNRTSVPTPRPSATPNEMPTLTPTATATTTPTTTPTLTSTATANPTPTSSTPTVRSSGVVNLRSGPGVCYDLTGQLQPGDEATILARSADGSWWQIRRAGSGPPAWVLASRVSAGGPIGTVPQASAVPPPPFQNFEPANGTPGDYFWNEWNMPARISTSQTQGHSKQAVLAHASAEANREPGSTATGGTLGINPCSPNPMDLSHASTISIWVYDTVGDNTVELKLRDRGGAVSNAVWSDPLKSVQNSWTQITWNLAAFEGVDKSQIRNIEVYEYHDGDYVFDTVTYQ